MGQAASKQEAFWEACGFGHTERVKLFIEQGIDVNWVSYTHDSCAIHVAAQGKEEIVKMLIEANCNVNARDERDNIALHHAAMKGHDKIAEMLIKAGSELNAQDKNFWTPVIAGAYFCHPGIVDMLLKHKCDVLLQNKDDRSALHEACRSQSHDEEGLGHIARQLIQAGSDLNSKSSDLGEADFTPLMFTAYHGHDKIAEALISAGCDINAQGSNGWSALHWASDRGHVHMIKLLLGAGVDPLLVGRRGELALDRASLREVRSLLQTAVDDARSAINSPFNSTASAQLAALRNSISAKAEENRALLAKVQQVEIDRRSPVSTMDGSESDRSMPGTPDLSYREKAELEPLEKNIGLVAPTAECEDLIDSEGESPRFIDSEVKNLSQWGSHKEVDKVKGETLGESAKFTDKGVKEHGEKSEKSVDEGIKEDTDGQSAKSVDEEVTEHSQKDSQKSLDGAVKEHSQKDKSLETGAKVNEQDIHRSLDEAVTEHSQESQKPLDKGITGHRQDNPKSLDEGVTEDSQKDGKKSLETGAKEQTDAEIPRFLDIGVGVHSEEILQETKYVKLPRIKEEKISPDEQTPEESSEPKPKVLNNQEPEPKDLNPTSSSSLEQDSEKSNPQDLGECIFEVQISENGTHRDVGVNIYSQEIIRETKYVRRPKTGKRSKSSDVGESGVSGPPVVTVITQGNVYNDDDEDVDDILDDGGFNDQLHDSD